MQEERLIINSSQLNKFRAIIDIQK